MKGGHQLYTLARECSPHAMRSECTRLLHLERDKRLHLPEGYATVHNKIGTKVSWSHDLVCATITLDRLARDAMLMHRLDRQAP